jgi:hypothetical protein
MTVSNLGKVKISLNKISITIHSITEISNRQSFSIKHPREYNRINLNSRVGHSRLISHTQLYNLSLDKKSFLLYQPIDRQNGRLTDLMLFATIDIPQRRFVGPTKYRAVFSMNAPYAFFLIDNSLFKFFSVHQKDFPK